MVFGRAGAAKECPPADASVIIPVYNHRGFVGSAIESVLSQTLLPRELICIDDGSTDGSAGVVEALAHEHPLIRFWSHPNRGAHATLNEGIAAARGTYIGILNSDDVYHPTRLARCMSVLEADPSVQAVATDIAFIDGTGKSVKNPWYEDAYAFFRSQGDLAIGLVNGNFLMSTSNLVARRSLFHETGPFAALRYAHDLDFFLRIVARNERLTVVPAPLLRYRMHSSNTISESHSKVRLEWAAAVAAFVRAIQRGPERRRPAPAYLGRLMDVAKRHDLTRLVALALLAPERHADTPASEPSAADLLGWLQACEGEREH